MIMNETLRERFRRWFERTGATGDWYVFYREIERAYETPPRAHHSFHGHIAFCVRELHSIPPDLVGNLDAVEIALFLHDIWMRFGGEDETRSALVAMDLCLRMGLSTSFAILVANHICYTDYRRTPTDPDSRLVADIDRSILGQDEAAYGQYERGIRTEYSFVPEGLFNARRSEVLTQFLEQPSIFLTDHFRNRYEDTARRNIHRSLRQLNAGEAIRLP